MDMNPTDGVIFDIYDTDANSWQQAQINLGLKDSNAFPTILKPCFFFADGALRISPGDFQKYDTNNNTTLAESVATGGTLNALGGCSTIQYGSSGATAYADRGDIISLQNKNPGQGDGIVTQHGPPGSIKGG